MKQCFIAVFVIIFIAGLQFSCKKPEDPLAIDSRNIVILSPSDSADIQIGTLMTIVVEVANFNEDPELVLWVNDISIQKKGMPPYNFTWDTRDWPLAYHTLHITSGEGSQFIEAIITILLIDTIPPPMAPLPLINISPSAGTTDSIFTFDASLSYDPDGLTEDLSFRWDFDGDGSWDTDFTDENYYLHIYTHPSNYQVRLEVMDADSMTSDTVHALLVSHSGNPNACGGYVSIPLGGKIYHTLAIGDQCWLRENLDIGEMIPGTSEPGNNGIIEKYCYNDDSLNCEEYGGLYAWDEIMNYVPLQGVRGICPAGWHIPTDAEWKELEAFADTHYGINNEIWDETGFRGYDAGKHLKSLLGWIPGGSGNNLFDYKALPAGSWQVGLGFTGMHEEARFWSSTHDSGENAFERLLGAGHDNISRDISWDKAAFSVRCLKD